MKSLLMRSAVSAVVLAGGLAAGSALAQSSTTPSPATPADEMNRAMDDAGRAIEHGANAVQQGVDNAMNAVEDDVNSQALPANTMASDILGENVVNAANDTIGTVNDILMTADGRIVAYEVAFGSVLGLGGDPVRVQPSELNIVADRDEGEAATEVDDYVISFTGDVEALKTRTPVAETTPLFAASDVQDADLTVANMEEDSDITDLVLSRTNQVDAVVLSTGGVAGVGATQRTMPIASLKLMTDGDALKAETDRDSLMNSPEIKG